MSISVKIPLEALSDPKVAKALSDLMMSLGGMAPSSVSRGQVAAGGDTVRTVAAPRRRRSAPKAPFGEGLSEEQRYAAFVDGLPAPSRRFLDLIRENSQVTLSAAIAELGITVPKAIGGITGSLSRWARDREVELPFKAAKSSSGERIWIWTRGADSPSGVAPQAKTGGKRSRSNRKKTAPAAKAAINDSPTSSEAVPPEADGGLYALLEGQTDTAREFLSLLSQRGELTMSDALKSFGLKHAQAIGAVIRSFRKRAKERNILIPFEENRSRTGERMWTWIGYPSADTDVDHEPARTGSGVLRRKRGQEEAKPV